MTKYQTFDSLQVNTPSGNSFTGFLIGSIDLLWRQPRLIGKSIGLSLAASTPLYLVGYHAGKLPSIGWIYAWVVGGLIAAVLVRNGLESDGFRTYQAGALKVYVKVAMLAALAAAAILFMFYLATSLLGRIDGKTASASVGFIDGHAWDQAKPVAISIVENTVAVWWKPMAHIAMGSTLTFAAYRAVIVTTPLRMRCRVTSRDARNFVCEKIAHRNQGYFYAALIIYVAGTTLVFVPLLNLVIPALSAAVCLVVYRAVLSSQ